jgi:hypothetical protein
MSWERIEGQGPVDARTEIPPGEGQGNFDGVVYSFRLRNVGDGATKTVWVRLKGTLVASDGKGETERHRQAVTTRGASEVDRRLEDENIPRCITFWSGGLEPVEDDECVHPLSE